MRQSEAQYAKRASAAPACLQLFNASQAAAKRGVAGPRWGWVCNEVCNCYVTKAVTRQSEAGPGWVWVCNEVLNG